jgi:inner membrane protein
MSTASDPFAPQPEALPPDMPPLPPRRSAPDYTSLSFHKLALIMGLVLATLVPSVLMTNLVEEREQRQAGVRQEFTRNWGPEQNVYSPILVIPYQGGASQPRQYVKVAPARLDVTANLTPQDRRRGLFQATVYEGKVDMQGAFAVPTEQRLRELITDKDARFFWSEAAVAIGATSNLTGLRSSDNIVIDGVEQQWVPCLEATGLEFPCRGAALVLAKAPVSPNASARMQFKSTISLRGTGSFALQYPGKELAATFRSSWPSPSFNGSTLPDTSTVAADGFEASWRTTEFGAPRITTSNNIIDAAMWKGPTISVDLIEATPIYRMITRVSKYALLFVVLSFATYFFFEMLARIRIHIVQYGLLGLSLSLFSLLLLSLAEPIGYTNGYLVAAGMVLTQSTLYTAAVARRFTPALTFALILASLFGFIYVLLGLETYSLLIGALALFVVVSALMILTQLVRWPGRPEPAETTA